MKVLVFAQNPEQMSALTAGARAIADDVVAIALNQETASAASADMIWQIALPEGCVVEDAIDTIHAIVVKEEPDAIYCEPMRSSRLIIGRLAAKLGTSAICDIIEPPVDGVVQHMVYGGMAIRSEKALTKTALYVISSGVFTADSSGSAGEIKQTDWVEPTMPYKRVSVIPRQRSAVNLADADIIVGVGRGIQAQSDLEMINSFAQSINAEVGCTRPIAEEEKWLPREVYIGVSGVMLNPDTYIAIGLSGQVQHMVGVNRAKTIVAINKEKNAPIFKQVDLGIVGDLYKIVPALVEALK